MKTISHKIKTDWGFSIALMGSKGESFVRLYVYNDTPSDMYVESLSVQEAYRRSGLGTQLLDIVEGAAKLEGFTDVYLWAYTSGPFNFVIDWYKRRGYEFVSNHETELDAVWLKKSLS